LTQLLRSDAIGSQTPEKPQPEPKGQQTPLQQSWLKSETQHVASEIDQAVVLRIGS
jgi:hypothetical protein